MATPAPNSAPPPASSPLTVGPYTVLRELGRGGQGVVHLAADAEGRQVAIKRLLSGSASAFARFTQEVTATRWLDHPGIVRVREVMRDQEGAPCIVTEFVAGGSLQARLDALGVCQEEEAIELGIQLAEAVAYAHERGLLHRDLKPANVLLSTDGRPVPTDFGLALLTEQAQRLTLTGEILGTPGYMAPEQALAEPELIDQRTDVYGLGGILYATLSGRSPLGATSLLNFVTASLLRDPEPLTEFGVSEELSRVVARCLAKQPADRFPSVQALLTALEACREGALPARRSVRPSVAAALAILVLGALAAAGFVASGDSRSDQGEALARESTPLRARPGGLAGSATPEAPPGSGPARPLGTEDSALAPASPSSSWTVAEVQGLLDRGLYTRALERLPRSPAGDMDRDVLLLRAQALGAVGRLDAAHEDVERLVALNPDDPLALMYLAQSWWLQRDAPQAHATWRRLLEAPVLEARILRVVEAEWPKLPWTPAQVEEVGQAAYRLEQGGQREAALSALRVVVKVAPETPAAQYRVGQQARINGSLEEAVRHLRRAVELYQDAPGARSPGGLMARFELGLALAGQGALSEALAAYDSVLALKPTHLGALFQRAQTLIRLDDVARARSDLEVLLKALPAGPSPERDEVERVLDGLAERP